VASFLEGAAVRGEAFGTRWYRSRGQLFITDRNGDTFLVYNDPKDPGNLFLQDKNGPALLYLPTVLSKVDLKDNEDIKTIFGSGVWAAQAMLVVQQPFGPPVLMPGPAHPDAKVLAEREGTAK